MSLTKLIETDNTKTIGSNSFSKSIGYTYNTKGLLETTVDFKNINNGALTTTYDYTGNYFGNITKKTVSASGVNDRYTSYGYDEFGRFVIIETNMLGQQTNTEYNSKFGVKTSVTDVLGNTVSSQYDGFGVLTQQNLPNGSVNTYTRNWYSGSDIANCIYYASGVLANAPDATVYYDAMGRSLRSQSVGFGNVTIYSDKVYNAKGQLYQSSLPYKSGDTPKWTTNAYYNDGRLESVDNDGLLTNYVYSGKTVMVTDPGGHDKNKTINNMGLVVSAEDEGGTITYIYDGSGAVKDVTASGSTISYGYDSYGRQVSVADPDAGNSSTEYNGFGEVTQTVDANNNTYSFTYDDAGRLLTKTGPEGDYTYSYNPVNTDSCGGLLGRIDLNGDNTTYDYNKYGQVLHETKAINNTNYVFSYGYDNKGNKTMITYPNGFVVKRKYDSEGRLYAVTENNNKSIWELNTVNELGLPTQITQGDDLFSTSYDYDNYYYLSGISNTYQDDDYLWDPYNGNLSERTNNINGQDEKFDYDPVNRLRQIKLNDVVVKEMSFADNGNINSKTDAGDYSYDPTKVHAVLQITDNNSQSAISTARQDVTYTAFNKIKTIKELNDNSDSLVYLYGSDMQRNRMELYNNKVLIKSRLYDGLYETETNENDETKQYCYVEGGFGITAVVINSNNQNDMYYLLRDHQGSIMGLVDDQRTLVEEYSYDAWGRRRNPTDWTYDDVSEPLLMFRGYTMHEMLDDFALINMNGRCYDPIVGRFLSPDIVVQDGNNTQCYNKYSYCLNNPLKYNDPSGWSYDFAWTHRHNYVYDWSEVDRMTNKLQHMWRTTSDDALLSYYCGLIMSCNSLEGATGANGEALMDQYGFEANSILQNTDNIPNITWMTQTTKFNDGSVETNTTYYLDGKITANTSVKNYIDNGVNKMDINYHNLGTGVTIAGYITYGIGENASIEAANFIYSAGERCGNVIISAEEFSNGGKAFFSTVSKYASLGSKGLFFLGAAINIMDAYNNPTPENIATNALDIGFGIAGTWGGPGGLMLASFYYAIRYTCGFDDYFKFYQNNPGFVPHPMR